MPPDFPAWSSDFQHHFRRLRSSGSSPRLHQFQLLFQAWLPDFLLAPEEEGPHSRVRQWPLRLTFWTFLWQVAQAGASCREAVYQAIQLCGLQARKAPALNDGPYCQARAKLPLERLEQIHRTLVADAQRQIVTKDLWQGHRVFVVDSTTVTLADTPDNQAQFPQQSVQKPGCGFPILRLGGLFCLATGLLIAWATGNWHGHELQLLNQLWESLQPGDVLLGDRGFCTYAVLARCQLLGLHGVFRARGPARCDRRRGRRLGPGEWEVGWKKPSGCPRTVDEVLWAQMPEQLTLRLVRCRAGRPGFRTREVFLITPLLDRQDYPAEMLSALYLRRWEMELSFRHLKTPLQMEHLSCRKPHTVQRELWMHLMVHNLVRRLMQQSARHYWVSLPRLSFAGALAGARRTAEALLQARTRRQRRELYDPLLQIIAEDAVRERPGRREPRAVKRRPKPYPLLTRHRRHFTQ
ncbi:MAG: IS4 family transposase [Verrucomicrobiae bacterium]|nr:IS4 family transposase [Verrucomicrobiae bacterium]